MSQAYDVRPAILSLASLSRAALATTGSGATFDSVVSGGAITSVTVLTGGTGYTPYTKLTLDGGGGDGAALVANVSGAGVITSVDVIDGGTGYTATPRITAGAYVQQVYPRIPRVFSDTLPVLFFEYRGGSNAENAYQTAFGSGMAGPSERNWTMDAIGLMALAKETDTADEVTREFVGVFHDFVRRNSTLGGTVDRAIVTADRAEPFIVNGGAGRGVVAYANILTISVTEYVE